jgi:hypothetical protein
MKIPRYFYFFTDSQTVKSDNGFKMEFYFKITLVSDHDQITKMFRNFNPKFLSDIEYFFEKIESIIVTPYKIISNGYSEWTMLNYPQLFGNIVDLDEETKEKYSHLVMMDKFGVLNDNS